MSFNLTITSKTYTLKENNVPVMIFGINLEKRLYMSYQVPGEGLFDHFFYGNISFNFEDMAKMVTEALAVAPDNDPIKKHTKLIMNYLDVVRHELDAAKA